MVHLFGIPNFLVASAAQTQQEYSMSQRNSGKVWSAADVKQLKQLAAANTPTRVIGLKLGRSESAVYSKASAEEVPLKPTNQSPYNRRKA